MSKGYMLILLIVSVAIITFGFITNNELPQDEHPDVDWSIGCQECHADETPDIYSAWENSKHGHVNFGCYICHGDGQETFYAKGIDDNCAGCHAAQIVEFEGTKFSSCYDCHDGHTLKFHNEQ